MHSALSLVIEANPCGPAAKALEEAANKVKMEPRSFCLLMRKS